MTLQEVAVLSYQMTINSAVNRNQACVLRARLQKTRSKLKPVLDFISG